jgi:putative PIN family toxin of toxin-antitoxin system
MNVIIDTNVALSGLLWQGPPNQILKWAREGVLEIIACRETVAELRRVLEYSRFSNRLKQLRISPAEAAAYYINLVQFVPTPEKLPEEIREDPFDNFFLALASENNARLIISGDHHLLELKSYSGIQIVTPSMACQVIEMLMHGQQ